MRPEAKWSLYWFVCKERASSSSGNPAPDRLARAASWPNALSDLMLRMISADEGDRYFRELSWHLASAFLRADGKKPTRRALFERIELGLCLPGQAGADDPIGLGEPVTKLGLGGAPGQVRP